jgi:hypothetical protein
MDFTQPSQSVISYCQYTPYGTSDNPLAMALVLAKLST